MKFKNTKPIRPKKQRAPKKTKEQKAGKLQFPSIYRKIPERSYFLHVLQILKRMVVFFVFAAIFTLILFLLADLQRNYVQNQHIQAERQKLIHELNIWKSFSDKYKNYKEVYFQIAVREFQLGDFITAGQYLKKSLFIDPNYEEALKLQKELENK
jgi:tetratricopeptide (TPR) repeat protein